MLLLHRLYEKPLASDIASIVLDYTLLKAAGGTAL